MGTGTLYDYLIYGLWETSQYTVLNHKNIEQPFDIGLPLVLSGEIYPVRGILVQRSLFSVSLKNFFVFEKNFNFLC